MFNNSPILLGAPGNPPEYLQEVGQIFVRNISSTTCNNVKKLKTWLKNLIIFLLYEGDSSQESFSLIVPAVGVSRWC